MHFDARVDAYEQSRPPYPEELWQRLEVLGLLRPGLRVLDLGAGTGQATARFVAVGARVTAVEPGVALAQRLHDRLPRVRIIPATAETAALQPAAFDLAVAATAAHWFDLAVVLPRLHTALSQDGHLAVWRNVYGDPDARTEFRSRIDAIVARRSSPPERAGPGELDIAGWAERLTDTGLFTVCDTKQWRWSIQLDARQIRDLFSTFSDWTEDEAAAADRAARDLDGTVTEHYRTWLIVLRRVTPEPLTSPVACAER